MTTTTMTRRKKTLPRLYLIADCIDGGNMNYVRLYSAWHYYFLFDACILVYVRMRHKHPFSFLTKRQLDIFFNFSSWAISSSSFLIRCVIVITSFSFNVPCHFLFDICCCVMILTHFLHKMRLCLLHCIYVYYIRCHEIFACVRVWWLFRWVLWWE